MNTNNDSLVGKRLSFAQLFNNNNLIIEIPTIQRDYAQGRKNKSELRDLFLQALSEYLKENKPERDLDFVYGSTEIENGIDKFIPLDGQQRLTTLFLLHWYLANKSGNIESFRNLMLLNNKSRFTYLTRPSSSEFVDALMLNDIDLDKLLVSPDKTNFCLSETIKDKGWYYLSWSYDPTIQSMLTMLDAIHNEFYDKAYFYERLINLEKPIITFQHLNLKEFNLTEDLYIKMNSRGKPLTTFENFKAKLEQHITLLFGETDKPFFISKSKIKASYREYFSFQIDTTWANLFWQYKHLVGKPYIFDEELMNFIRVIIANQYAIENPDNSPAFKELIKNESATAEITENISFHKFKVFNALTKNCIIYLIEAFDILVNEDKRIKNHLTDTFYFNENDVFEKALKYSLSLPERAVFHSYLRGLISNATDKTNFYQWMRVVHNLVENSRIEVADQLTNAIESIEKLLPHSENILGYLASSKCSIGFFSSWQVEEEIIKAHLILKSNTWQSAIEDYEKQSFHKGQLGYLFEFSEVLAYYNTHKSCNWSLEEDEIYFNSFKNYASKSVALFSIYDTPENEGYLLERALLTKGNYLIPATHNRYNLCSSKRVSNYQRDYSWKRLLRFTTEYVDFWANKRVCVKELLDDVNFDTNNIATFLSGICKNAPNDWRANLVKNSSLIDYCNQGFVKIIDNYEVELYKASQQNHYHCDMYIYNLFTTKFSGNKDDYTPFNIEMVYVKNSEDFSVIKLENLILEKKAYDIEIYHLDKDKEYKITFSKSKNQNVIEDENFLESRGFEWIEENQNYLKSMNMNDEDAIQLLIKELCSEFKELKNE